MDGYGHAAYAESFEEFGTPRELSTCGGWILKRRINGFPHPDAMGCYPLFVCRDWSGLKDDCRALRGEIVSLTLVTDPFGNYDENLLRDCFPDRMTAFKQHFIIDMHRPLYSWVSEHHRRYAHRALKTVSVEYCDNPIQDLDGWMELYKHLVDRHGIKGIAAFSRNSFAKQMKVPGMIAFRARVGGQLAGMLLWFVQGDIAYYHLGAYDPIGYEHHASFALFWVAMAYFSRMGMRWLNLGANPGSTRNLRDGLARFKQGWSTGTRTAYLCGRIFDQSQYRKMTRLKGLLQSDYFPAYRTGEFV